MNNKENNLWNVSARIPYAVVDGCVAFFENDNFLGISWTECEDSEPLDLLDDNGFPIASEFQLDAFSKTKPDLDFIRNAVSCLYELAHINTVVNIDMKIVDDTDWLLACYSAMPAQKYGDFYIYGSHIKDPCPDNLLPVLVDAATAFGSGEHPTTAGCLTVLSKIAKNHQFNSILDMGCGSGILGIAAKKKMPEAKVVLADFDPESVRVSKQNAIVNNVDVVCFESLGFDNLEVSESGPFDLVLANILAKPLCELSESFAKNTLSGSYIILSGLLTRHGDMIKEYYQRTGFTFIESIVINDWLTMVFKKKF